MRCVSCQKETTNPKFCSRSCSAKFTNKIPKRKKRLHKCNCCDKLITIRNKYCSKCLFNLRNEDISIKEAKSRYEKHHRTSVFALIRTRARTIAKELGWKSCSICQYSKHIEIAHIKAISDFDENTLINIVNHPDNLKPLCPNCHWEFDNLK